MNVCLHVIIPYETKHASPTAVEVSVICAVLRLLNWADTYDSGPEVEVDILTVKHLVVYDEM